MLHFLSVVLNYCHCFVLEVNCNGLLACLWMILQGDVLITKCTYNTEDRSKPTVVSSALYIHYVFHMVVIFFRRITLSTPSSLLHALHISPIIYLFISHPAVCFIREVLASWRKCASTTFTTTLVLSWSSARATLTQNTCRNTLTSLTGSDCTPSLPRWNYWIVPLFLHSCLSISFSIFLPISCD